jgi:hypothetical protein
MRPGHPARRYLPELAPSWDRMLVLHLLTQTLGFGFRLSAYRDRSTDEIMNAIFTARFTFPPLRRFTPGEIAPTEMDDDLGEIRGVVHNESARALRGKMMHGSACPFSIAPDLLRFAATFLNG